MNKQNLITCKIDSMLSNLENVTARAAGELRESASSHPSFQQNESDAAKAEIDLNTALMIHGHCVSRQRSLRRAVQSIALGTYGQCLRCRSGISERRLAAMPSASRCRDCQDEKEARAARTARPKRNDAPVWRSVA